jgi:hypothetical protein
MEDRAAVSTEVEERAEASNTSIEDRAYFSAM